MRLIKIAICILSAAILSIANLTVVRAQSAEGSKKKELKGAERKGEGEGGTSAGNRRDGKRSGAPEGKSPSESSNSGKAIRPIVLDPMVFYIKGKKIEIKNPRFEDVILRAQELFDKGEYRGASRYYEKILEFFLLPPAVKAGVMYNLALSYENSGQYFKAIPLYREILQKFPKLDKNVKIETLFRLAFCYERLNLWKDAYAIYDQLLDMTLDILDRLEAQTGAAIALFYLKEFRRAEPQFKVAVKLYELIRNRKGGDKYVPAEIREQASIAYFYWARIYDLKFRQRKFKLPQSQMKKDLEFKAKNLLKAQKLYIKAISLGHPLWVRASLDKLGEMYETLYRDILNAPIPPDLTPEEQEIYVQLLKERIRNLLDKALIAYYHNIRLARRWGWESRREREQIIKKVSSIVKLYAKTFKTIPKPLRQILPEILDKRELSALYSAIEKNKKADVKSPATRPSSRPATTRKVERGPISR